MSDPERFKGRVVAVFGLARSGLSAALALRDRFGAKVIAWDDDLAGRDAASAQGIELRELLTDDPARWAALVLSPGVPLTHKPHAIVIHARRAHVPIIGDIELLWLSGTGGRLVGITGTNGKSTTTSLVGHVLEHSGRRTAVGGNIGFPVLSLPPVGADGVSVIEMSSYQLDLIDETRFSVASLLNITPDHLDRHGDMAGYIAAKSRIFRNQTSSDCAIVSLDDPFCRGVAATLAAQSQNVVPISVEAPTRGGVWVADGELFHDGTRIMDLKPITTLPGRHNWQNAAAAYATAWSLGLGRDETVNAISSFAGLAHRQEQVGAVGRIRFVNDSKATNADAAEKALAAYSNIRWIAGGVAKSGGVEQLVDYFPALKGAYLIGEAAGDFAETIGGATLVRACGSLEAAVAAAYEDAQSDPEPSVILLSPACASFDQYPNFEVRGDAFKAIVRRILAAAAS